LRLVSVYFLGGVRFFNATLVIAIASKIKPPKIMIGIIMDASMEGSYG
jgi:hypothetical protein